MMGNLTNSDGGLSVESLVCYEESAQAAQDDNVLRPGVEKTRSRLTRKFRARSPALRT